MKPLSLSLIKNIIDEYSFISRCCPFTQKRNYYCVSSPIIFKIIPYYSERNNYKLYMLIKMLKIKTIKQYTVLIKKIISTYSKYSWSYERPIIKDYCLFPNYYLKEVVIPSSIKNFDFYLKNFDFYLKNLVIPNGVLLIITSNSVNTVKDYALAKQEPDISFLAFDAKNIIKIIFKR